MTERYGVFGNPIHHSKSPLIHRAFAEQAGHQLTYDAVLVGLGNFAMSAEEFFRGGGKGINVTVPFKRDAFHFADALSERARLAGAVNTLTLRDDGRVFGDNTDGCGLVRDFVRMSWSVVGKKVLLIGAGGAVRGVVGPLLQEQPALLLVANRTAQKAEALVNDFCSHGNIVGGGYDQIGKDNFDIIINGTSASLFGDSPPIPHRSFGRDCLVYDMAYGDQTTPFLALAKSFNVAQTADGLGMLVGQAAESFYIWRGVHPDINPVITLLASPSHKSE